MISLRTLLALSLPLLLAVSACRDTAAFAVPKPSTRRVAQLSVSQTDSLVTVTLRVSGFSAVPIASVGGFIDFDARVLRYVGDSTAVVGGAHASRDAGGRVMLAAAHPRGFAEEEVISLRFVALRTTASPQLALTLHELMLIDGANALPMVAVSNSATMLRGAP